MPVPELLAGAILKTPRWRRKSLHRLRWPSHSGTLSDCAPPQFVAMHYGEPLPLRSAIGKKSIPPRDAGAGLAVRRSRAAAPGCR